MYDKNTNKIIGTIEAPFLVDADGKEDYKSVEYKLEKDGENEALKVIVSNDYFENEATKYPVTIDPTMVWMFDYLTTASVWSVEFQQNVNMHNHYLGAMNNMISSYPYNSEEHVYLDTSNLLTVSALVGSGLNISVQSSLNKVSIKYNLHRHLHTDAYYIAVHTLLKKAEGSYAKTTKTLTFIKALLLAASSKTP